MGVRSIALLLAISLLAGAIASLQRSSARNEPNGSSFASSSSFLDAAPLVLRAGSPYNQTASTAQDEKDPSSMELSIDLTTGGAILSIDHQPWLELAESMHVVGWTSSSSNNESSNSSSNAPLRLISTAVTHETGEYRETKGLGNYVNVSLVWESSSESSTLTEAETTSNEQRLLTTNFLVFEERPVMIFEQIFVTGWVAPQENKNNNTNSTPWAIVAGFPSIPLDLPKANLGTLLWKGCFAHETYAGEWSGLEHGPGGSAERATGKEEPKKEHSPSRNSKETQQQQRHQAEQKTTVDQNDYTYWFDGNESGQPWVLHDENGRSIVWSSLENFFVSGFAARRGGDCQRQHQQGEGKNAQQGTTSHDKPCSAFLDMGLRTTLESIPPGHVHSTILVGGTGINSTVMEWGDLLLQTTDQIPKQRSKVYEDFALAHLGYWTDSGAYHAKGGYETDIYSSMEEALVGVKDGMTQQGIPIRYMQWDDWWMDKHGNFPGMISWTPKPNVFPSGFSDWLGMPLALYAPAYFAENVWRKDYEWKVDPVQNTSIPIDPKFYRDLFQNGTSIGMTLFEQDFLCASPFSIGSTSLTNTDVHTGKQWFANMDAAARALGITLQFCMADAYHILQATALPSVTNARATRDNLRNYNTIRSMGQNSLLFYATGIYASRDNVWTTRANLEQIHCGNPGFCYEPNAHLDNAAAVLAGGPYGIGDGLAYVNATVVQRSCRSDGLLLRPRWPLAALDFTFTQDDAKGLLVWAAHDEYLGNLRWSYVVGVDLPKNVAIAPRWLLQGFPSPSSERMVAWEVVMGAPVTEITVFSEEAPLILPPSKPLDLPYDVNSPPHTHYATAPVLPNGMAFLGEVSKWATMSFGRIVGMEADEDSFSIRLRGAPSEVVTFSYVLDAVKGGSNIEQVQCFFPSVCPEMDMHGNSYCQKKVSCHKTDGCSCDGGLVRDEEMLLRGSTTSG